MDVGKYVASLPIHTLIWVLEKEPPAEAGYTNTMFCGAEEGIRDNHLLEKASLVVPDAVYLY